MNPFLIISELPQFSEALNEFAQVKIETIIHTVSDYEMWAVLTVMEPPALHGEIPGPSRPVDLCISGPYRIIVGMFGKFKIALVQTGRGASCRDGIEGALVKLKNVRSIIAVGIAYGDKKYKFGDVLVSTIIHGVQTQLKDGKLVFGLSSTRFSLVSQYLRDTFVERLQSWKLSEPFFCSVEGRKSTAYSGILISSPTLVSDEMTLDEFLQDPRHEAIGIEMEGGELLKIQKSYSGKTPSRELGIIVIKGVAGVADGSKQKGKEWQFTAAMAAANYTKFNMIHHGELYGMYL